jgi:hypothetical protein
MISSFMPSILLWKKLSSAMMEVYGVEAACGMMEGGGVVEMW